MKKIDENVKYWINLSEYDLETAWAMQRSKRFLYTAFMCHQAIEKIFKAYYTHLTKETAPYSHSLSHIARKGGFYDELNEAQMEFLDHLEPLNIETRYPVDRTRLMNALSEHKCAELLSETQELQKWIKEKL